MAAGGVFRFGLSLALALSASAVRTQEELHGAAEEGSVASQPSQPAQVVAPEPHQTSGARCDGGAPGSNVSDLDEEFSRRRKQMRHEASVKDAAAGPADNMCGFDALRKNAAILRLNARGDERSKDWLFALCLRRFDVQIQARVEDILQVAAASPENRWAALSFVQDAREYRNSDHGSLDPCAKALAGVRPEAPPSAKVPMDEEIGEAWAAEVSSTEASVDEVIPLAALSAETALPPKAVAGGAELQQHAQQPVPLPPGPLWPGRPASFATPAAVPPPFFPDLWDPEGVAPDEPRGALLSPSLAGDFVDAANEAFPTQALSMAALPTEFDWSEWGNLEDDSIIAEALPESDNFAMPESDNLAMPDLVWSLAEIPTPSAVGAGDSADSLDTASPDGVAAHPGASATASPLAESASLQAASQLAGSNDSQDAPDARIPRGRRNGMGVTPTTLRGRRRAAALLSRRKKRVATTDASVAKSQWLLPKPPTAKLSPQKPPAVATPALGPAAATPEPSKRKLSFDATGAAGREVGPPPGWTQAHEEARIAIESARSNLALCIPSLQAILDDTDPVELLNSVQGYVQRQPSAKRSPVDEDRLIKLHFASVVLKIGSILPEASACLMRTGKMKDPLFLKPACHPSRPRFCFVLVDLTADVLLRPLRIHALDTLVTRFIQDGCALHATSEECRRIREVVLAECEADPSHRSYILRECNRWLPFVKESTYNGVDFDAAAGIASAVALHATGDATAGGELFSDVQRP